MAFCRSWLRSLFPERQQVRSTSPAKYTTRDFPISGRSQQAPLSVACEDKPFLVEKLDTQEQRSIPEESSPPHWNAVLSTGQQAGAFEAFEDGMLLSMRA